MADPRPNQDQMNPAPAASPAAGMDPEASYLRTDDEDEEDVHDLGFIVEDHDDRRVTLVGDRYGEDQISPDEPEETASDGSSPARREAGLPQDAFATDFHGFHARAEAQEEDFVRTSMLDVDPDPDATDELTSDTFAGDHGQPMSTDIAGRVGGVAMGLGTSLPQDLGEEGFQILDNPLAMPQGQPISGLDFLDQPAAGTDDEETGSGDERERFGQE